MENKPKLHGSEVPGDVSDRDIELGRKALPLAIATGMVLMVLMLSTVFVDKPSVTTGGGF